MDPRAWLEADLTKLVLRFLQTDSWSVRRDLVAAHQVLLSPEALQVVDRLLELARGQGSPPIILDGLRERRAMLERWQLSGADAAREQFAAQRETERRKVRELGLVSIELLQAPDWPATRLILERHVELLYWMPHQLESAGKAAAREGYTGEVEFYHFMIQLLTRCLQIGIEPAFAERHLDDPGAAKEPVPSTGASDQILRRLCSDLSDQIPFAEYLAQARLARAFGRFVAASTWANALRLLADEPDLAYLPDDLPDGPAFDETIATHLEALRRYRETGALEGLGAKLFEPTTPAVPPVSIVDTEMALIEVIFDFIQAGSEAEVRQMVDAHPELLTDQAENQLAALIVEALREDRDAIAESLLQRQRLLVSLRKGRVPFAQRVEEISAVADLAHRAELLRQELARMPRFENPIAWASLQALLGATLAELTEERDGTDYDSAIRAYELALDEFTADAVPAPWASAQYQLGKVLLRRKTGRRTANVERAIRALSAALTVDRGAFGAAWLDCQLDLAEAYLESDVERALALATTVAQEAAEPSQPEYPRVHRILGEAYDRRTVGPFAENTELAIAHLELALAALDREEFGIAWASTQLHLGTVYRNRSGPDRARSLASALQALEAARQRFADYGDETGQASALNGMGNVYDDASMPGQTDENIETAIACFESALELLTREPDPTTRATVQHNLAGAYLRRISGDVAGNVRAAFGLLEAALAVRTKQDYPTEHAATQISVGNAWMNAANTDRLYAVERAVSAYQAAIDVFEITGRRRDLAAAYHSCAQAYFGRDTEHREEDLERSLSFLDRAREIFAAEGMRLEAARALGSSATALSELSSRPGHLEAAITRYLAALDALGSEPGYGADRALILSNLGAVYVEHGDIAQAIGCLEAAVAEPNGQDGLARALTRSNLGQAYAEQATRDRAELELRRALEVLERLGVDVHVRRTARALGDVYSRMGDRWPEALRSYEIALAADDRLYLGSLQVEAKESELEQSQGLHPRAAYAAARAERPRAAVSIVERGRARSLGAALARDMAEVDRLKRVSEPNHAAFLAAVQQVRAAESQEREAAARGRFAGPASAGPVLDVPMRERLSAARAALAQAVQAVRDLGAEYQNFLAAPGFDDVTSACAAAGPIVYLACTPYGSLTLLVTAPRELETDYDVRVVLGELTAGDLAQLLVQHTDDGLPTGYLPWQTDPRTSTVDLPRLLADLDTAIARPLAEAAAARDVDRLTLIPCGLLALVPLHATLISRWPISFAPSARVLDAACTMALGREREPHTLAGVGDPAFTYPALPYGRAELEVIAGLIPANSVFYAEGATRGALFAAGRDATHVHLSCHGYFDPGAPARSGFALAGPGRPDYLTVQDILTQEPFRHARLVVASACQTAVSDFLRLPDEAVGLPAAFLQGGTPGVVGTLWSVNDLSTALLMVHFYEYLLAAIPAAPALARAQVWLAQATAGELESFASRYEPLRSLIPRGSLGTDPAVKPYRDPYHWAAFVFVGA